jgi:hypothetical protein
MKYTTWAFSLALGLLPSAARAEHFDIKLTATGPDGSSKEAFADQSPPIGGLNPRPVLRAEAGDTSIGKGRIPDHISASITYDGITGATLSARAAHDSWSSLTPLSSTHIQAFDGWDTSVGAEVTGPRLIQRIIIVRAGARFRTLPFAFNGEKVSDTSFMAGLGAPLARDRASLDFAVQHASRSVTGPVKETGYILSFGLRVTP